MQTSGNRILISFIIPAHNAEKTIQKAIESIGRSELAEILVIENGSEDNTTAKVQSLAENDNRIILLHSEKGVSNARNAGLEAATGQWIAFLDADDYLEDGAASKLIEYANADEADLYLYGHTAGIAERKLTDRESELWPSGRMDEGIARMLENPTLYMQAWGKLFKSSIIKENGLRFDPALRLAEDSDFTLRYVLHAGSAAVKGAVLYHYTLNPVSVMRNTADDKITAYENAMIASKKAIGKAPAMIREAFRNYILMHFNIAMVRGVFAGGNLRKIRSGTGRMKKAAERPVFHEAIARTKVREYRSFRMLPILLIKVGLWYPAALVYTVRAGMNRKRENLARGE